MRISDWSSDVCSSDLVWFRMNIGRNNNADPRWLLPLLCRRGHITKHEVGAIRIFDRETRFEIPSAIAGKFVAALKRTGASDDRSEARRVGKECVSTGRSRGEPDNKKQTAKDTKSKEKITK